MSNALIIVCGGLSTRMGCDKAFLPFGESSLLKYQIERYRPYFSNIYLSVPAYENRPIDYKAHCGCDTLQDLYANIGPMGGLYSCLKQTTEDVLFFTAVDAPFTDPKLALRLCEELEADPSADAATIHDIQGLAQPLFSAYKKSCMPTLEQLIEEECFRLRVCLKQVNTLVIDDFFPAEQFFNMNDPKSYYFALGQLAKKQPALFPPELFVQDKEQVTAPVISFTARSGTGKTTYLEKLIPLLKQQQIRLAMLKHDAHGFEIDKPGKDSWRFTQAGADHIVLTSRDQTAAIISHKGQSQDLDFLLRQIQNADLIITEGYKLGDQKKIQILRKGYHEAPVGNTENTIAYVTDFPYESDLPVFDLNDPAEIVPFLMDYMNRESR